MSLEKITIPEELLRLKPSAALESVPMSKLARTGTKTLQKIMATSQAVAVKIQGQGAMVTVSQRQYDEMVKLIGRLRREQSDDGFTRALGQQFDELVARMNRPGAVQATEATLFDDPAQLNETYRPGATEADD